MNESDRLLRLAERIGHAFSDPFLLEIAVSHRSWCAENDGAPSNERLEFLGDAVLGWVVADIAFRRHALMSEGELTDLRKRVVNAHALADVARALDLGPHVRLGRGEAAAGGADKPSILSDTFEAVLAAVYLDGGSDAAAAVVEAHVAGRLDAELDGARGDHVDHKTRLQELCAAAGLAPPRYEVTSTGPDHDKVFVASVWVDGNVHGQGEGTSKKAAEQSAAEVAGAVLDSGHA